MGYAEDVMSKNKTIHLMFAAFVLAVLCHGSAGAAEAESVAIVTDLTGKAVVLEKSGKRAISILFEIKSDTKVQLDDNARMIILYMKSSQEYEIRGPSIVQFKSFQPESTSGNKPKKRSILFGAGGKGVRIDPVTVAQAAMVMRSMEPVLMLETHPELRWEPAQPHPEYRFTLNDEAGNVLLETVVAACSYKLPPAINLDDKRTYKWRVAAPPQDDESYSASGLFRIAPVKLRKLVESIRPHEADSLSEHVAFAIWLEQMKLKNEARKYWRMAATKRPDDPQLVDLAAN